jgi:membrane associated rhomboid family serine protease
MNENSINRENENPELPQNINQSNNHSNNQNRSDNSNNFINQLKFSYRLFLILNIIIFIFTKINLNISDFSICSWPIFSKHQYYRIITHHYFHSGFLHFFLNMTLFTFECSQLEKKIGSSYLFLIISNSLILISLIYLGMTAILKYMIISLLKFTEYNFDFYCSAGFSGVLFCIYYIQCNFKRVAEGSTLFLGLIPVRIKYSPFIYILLIQVLSPNSSLLGHISGVVAGWTIKRLFSSYILPSLEAIYVFEYFLKRYKFRIFDTYQYLDCIAKVNVENELKEFSKRDLQIGFEGGAPSGPNINPAREVIIGRMV